jgi:hypothetical protein
MPTNGGNHSYSSSIPAPGSQLPGHQFVIDCQFPDVPREVPRILGIGGDVLRQLTIRFDGTPRLPIAPYGHVFIEVRSRTAKTPVRKRKPGSRK